MSKQEITIPADAETFTEHWQFQIPSQYTAPKFIYG